MVLRSISILATLVLMAAAAALVFRGAILGTGPVSISLQLLGLALMIWARLTFGLRSFHYAANPTQGGLVTKGPYTIFAIRFTLPRGSSYGPELPSTGC